MLLKKIYLSNKAHSTIQHMFTKEKKIPGQKVGGGGWGSLGQPLNSPLLPHSDATTYTGCGN